MLVTDAGTGVLLKERRPRMCNYHWISLMKQVLFGGILSGLSLPRMVTSERDIVTEAKMGNPAR